MHNLATTTPPLSFPKSYIAFSKSKQDVWFRLVLAMDGQQEPVRYKSNLWFGLKSDSVSVFLLTFSSDQEKVKSPTGRNHCIQQSKWSDERRRANAQNSKFKIQNSKQ